MSEPVYPDSLRGPARPETLTVDFYEDLDGIVIHKKRGGGPGLFLVLWLIAWTVGCIALVVAFIRNPAIGNLAFAIPFWASWLCVAGLLVWIIFGKETLLLRRDAALFRRTALIRISSRVVPRAEIQNFRECRSSHTENDEHLWGIEMVTLGKPLRFVFRLPDQEFVMALFGLMPVNNQNNVQQGWEWWGLFVFLIPFEVIGMGMFAALIFVVLEPFRWTVWRFEQGRIIRQTRWPAYHRTREWEVVKLDRLELRRHRASDPRRQSVRNAIKSTTAQSPFEFAFVSDGNVDLCKIDGLTEGEVRWFAHVILDRRANWFGT